MDLAQISNTTSSKYEELAESGMEKSEKVVHEAT